MHAKLLLESLPLSLYALYQPNILDRLTDLASFFLIVCSNSLMCFLPQDVNFDAAICTQDSKLQSFEKQMLFGDNIEASVVRRSFRSLSWHHIFRAFVIPSFLSCSYHQLCCAILYLWLWAYCTLTKLKNIIDIRYIQQIQNNV